MPPVHGSMEQLATFTLQLHPMASMGLMSLSPSQTLDPCSFLCH